MPIPSKKSTSEDIISSNEDSQADNGQQGFGARLRDVCAEKGWKQADLARKSSISPNLIGTYWHGTKEASTRNLFALADALCVSAEWLAFGKGSRSPNAGRLVEVGDADWVDIPEHDIRELTDESRGPVVSTTPIRKDWLNQTFGTSNGLWFARLPADLPRYRLNEGDLVFVRDLLPGEAQDGAIYIVRVWGHLTVARLDTFMSNQMRSVETNIEDRVLAPRDIGTEDGKAILVARVLGAPLRRL